MGLEDIYDHYERELLYLRRAGEGFSRAYPKVARRLALGPDMAGDPHVERLIESFAFLTARLQLDLERRFPLLTEAILSILYPHLTAPVPSCGIAHFRPDSQLTEGNTLPRGTPVVAMAGEGVRCRFTTAAPVTLWPFEVAQTTVQSVDDSYFNDTAAASVLRVDLASVGTPFEKISLRKVRLFINAEPAVAAAVYEALTTSVLETAYVSEGGEVHRLHHAVTPGGFDEDDILFPYPGNGHPAYRLINEYYAFPEKFLFLDIAVPEHAFQGNRGSIFFALSRPIPRRLHLRENTLLTGCAPVVNLFSRVCEPVRLDQRRTEYLVVADATRDRITEVHTIESVVGIERGGTRVPYTALFSVKHGLAGEKPEAFWHTTRAAAVRADMIGTDTWIGLFNDRFEATKPAAETVIVTAQCTNRGLAEKIPAGATLSIENSALVSGISLLYKPTPPRYRTGAGETTWKLVSQLSLNHLSLSSDGVSLDALQEILALHAGDDPAAHAQISALKSLAVRPVVSRIGQDAWRGFCRGLEVTLDIDERGFVGASPLVFGEVLSHFFDLYVSVNSFTELQFRSVNRGGGTWKRWRKMGGAQFAL